MSIQAEIKEFKSFHHVHWCFRSVAPVSVPGGCSLLCHFYRVLVLLRPPSSPIRLSPAAFNHPKGRFVMISMVVVGLVGLT